MKTRKKIGYAIAVIVSIYIGYVCVERMGDELVGGVYAVVFASLIMGFAMAVLTDWPVYHRK